MKSCPRWLTKQLSPAELRAAQTHISNCPSCTARLAELRTLRAGCAGCRRSIRRATSRSAPRLVAEPPQRDSAATLVHGDAGGRGVAGRGVRVSRRGHAVRRHVGCTGRSARRVRGEHQSEHGSTRCASGEWCRSQRARQSAGPCASGSTRAGRCSDHGTRGSRGSEGWRGCCGRGAVRRAAATARSAARRTCPEPRLTPSRAPRRCRAPLKPRPTSRWRLRALPTVTHAPACRTPRRERCCPRPRRPPAGRCRALDPAAPLRTVAIAVGLMARSSPCSARWSCAIASAALARQYLHLPRSNSSCLLPTGPCLGLAALGAALLAAAPLSLARDQPVLATD